MAGMPTGTVTFLFTDIEGSTRLWENQPGPMSVALARHDALLRGVIEREGGHVFKTVGDAFCAAFHTPQDAIAAACAAQQAIANEPWPAVAPIKVRMAVHTGAAEVRDNDYFGQPVNRVARLLSIGHGGQVLASLATQEIARDTLPRNVALQDMGEARLKDLIRPERVYQVVAPGIGTAFPALKSLDARNHNLPVQSTSFIGRERELPEATKMLLQGRMVTMTGPGGTGKTRLALQAAAEIIDNFPAGVWVLELGSVREAAGVVQALAQVLNVKEDQGRPILDVILGKLSNEQPLLLVIDNCEHLVDACAAMCDQLLRRCAGVKILATSREALRVPGEAALPVAPLELPDPASQSTPASLAQFAAVQLFVERALAVKPGFKVDAGNAPAVASICHRLDGIPLAIELAASRVRSMSPNEINERLDKSFQLLTGGARTALPRQQTLRSLIDWSYDTLQPAERLVFDRLAVFVGGCTIAAAEHVCSDDTVEGWQVADLLSMLSDKSLIASDEHAGETRYRMLETIRQYAAERLAAHAGADDVRRRHFEFFSGRMANRWGPQDKVASERLTADLPNLRAALSWALAHDVPAGVEMANSVLGVFFSRLMLREGKSWGQRFLEAGGRSLEPRLRAQMLGMVGLFAHLLGDKAAGAEALRESIAIGRELGDRKGVAHDLRFLAFCTSDPAETVALLDESAELMRETGDRFGYAAVLNHRAILASFQRDFPLAVRLNEECLAIAREVGNRNAQAATLNCLGSIYIETGELDRAVEMATASLSIRRELSLMQGVAGSMLTFAAVAAARGDPLRAATLWACAKRLNAETGLALERDEQEDVERRIAQAKASVPEVARFDAAWAAGEVMTVADGIEFALRSQAAAVPDDDLIVKGSAHAKDVPVDRSPSPTSPPPPQSSPHPQSQN